MKFKTILNQSSKIRDFLKMINVLARYDQRMYIMYKVQGIEYEKFINLFFLLELEEIQCP